MNSAAISFLLVIFCLTNIIAADKAHPHLHSEVKIVGYNGPMSKEILTFFRGAEYIEIFDCKVTQVSGHVYSQLPKLKRLYLENNTFTNVNNENVMQGALSLTDFHFINNELDAVNLTTIRNLPNLKLFRVESMRVKHPAKTIHADSFTGTNFHDFVYRNNSLEEIEAGAFNGVDNLKKLDLADNKLKTFSKDVIPHSKKLEKLDLSGNLIESFSTDNLPEAPTLAELNLSRNPLKSLNLNGITKVAPNLKKLYIAGTSIPESQLEELRKNNTFEIVQK